MFGKLMGSLKLGEANGIVRQALKALPVPALPFDPDQTAIRLVAISYNTQPGLFDGKLGKRPHPITTAAVSLAGGLSYDDFEFPRTAKQCVHLALGNVLLDASGNATRYGLGPVDLRLLEMAQVAYLDHQNVAA